jgi:cyclase
MSLSEVYQSRIAPPAAGRRQARLFRNVERAYREFRHEPTDESRDSAKAFDAIYRVGNARGLKVVF